MNRQKSPAPCLHLAATFAEWLCARRPWRAPAALQFSKIRMAWLPNAPHV
jgi:hypothetical protein